MKTFMLGALLVMTSVGAVEAQGKPVILPDTAGADFDVDSPGTASPSDFDFLLGEWTFRFQNRAGDGWGRVINGTWEAREVRPGLIEDEWTLGSGEPTLTWRVYNPQERRWELMGLRLSRGSWDPGIAWSRGNQRFVVQTIGGTVKARIRYYDITPGHFRWRADTSRDGVGWDRDQWIMEVTRVPEGTDD